MKKFYKEKSNENFPKTIKKTSGANKIQNNQQVQASLQN